MGSFTGPCSLDFMEDRISSEESQAGLSTCDVSVLKPQSTRHVEVNLREAVRDHYKTVYRFALHISKHPEDAADLTQYAYETLARKHHQIADASKVKGWLQSTVYRKFIDQKRRIIRFPQVEYDESIIPHYAPEGDFGERMDAQTVLQALMKLDEDLRAPISLFYLEFYSYKEIAQILDLPIGTVMSRLYRGKKMLYQSLTSTRS